MMLSAKQKFRILRLALCAAVILCCVYSEKVMDAIKAGIALSVEQLIPSLFIFLILANLYFPAQGRKNRISEKLHLPQGFFGTLLLTVTGGFPVGAVCIRRAYTADQLTVKQAKRLSAVLFCCGPGFMINYIGISLCGSKEIGLLALTAQILSLFIGILGYMILSRRDQVPAGTASENGRADFSLGVLSAVRSMANICATVIFFMAISSILSPVSWYLPQKLWEVISGISEVTSGCAGLRSFTGNARIMLMLFFCGFGGICVHMQVYGILKECAPAYPLFFAVRLLLAGCSVGIFRLLMLIIKPEIPDSVCFNIDQSILPQSSTDSPAVFILLIAASLLFCASFFPYSGKEKTASNSF